MGLGIAVVGVVGTVSAAALTQLAALRGKRIDAEIQRLQRKDERQEAVSLATQEQKQALYAELNTAARHYRTIVRDHLADLRRDSTTPIPEQLEPARSTYRDLFSKAQMVLPEPALAVAVVLNDCLGQGYSALRALHGPDSPTTIDELLMVRRTGVSRRLAATPSPTHRSRRGAPRPRTRPSAPTTRPRAHRPIRHLSTGSRLIEHEHAHQANRPPPRPLPELQGQCGIKVPDCHRGLSSGPGDDLRSGAGSGAGGARTRDQWIMSPRL